MNTKTTFESLMLQFANKHAIHEAFQDFLTVTLGVFTKNPSRTLLMATYARYSEAEIKNNFPQILQCLMHEIEDRSKSPLGNDVLGEFYETHISKSEDKRILPWEKCVELGSIPISALNIIPRHWPIPLLDVGCRSGRIMLSTSGKAGLKYEFLGVEYNWDFILITTLNLFFNFHWNSEVLWVDPNNSNAFKESYQILVFPNGIIRNLDREKSKAWDQYQTYLSLKKQQATQG